MSRLYVAPDGYGDPTIWLDMDTDGERDEAVMVRTGANAAGFDALAVLVEGAEVLRLVRLVEADMADRAFNAWRAADARRGLSDHDALLAHADALTRWSERFRMAFDGEDYRGNRIEAAS